MSETPTLDGVERLLRWGGIAVALICAAAFVSFLIQGVMAL